MLSGREQHDPVGGAVDGRQPSQADVLAASGRGPVSSSHPRTLHTRELIHLYLAISIYVIVKGTLRSSLCYVGFVLPRCRGLVRFDI